MPWRPSEPGEYPTLGWLAIEWMTGNLARPESQEYEPFVPTQEQADFLLAFYRIDPITLARTRRRGVISRPRGWGKALALDTPIPTPSGWATMGAIARGDTLFDETGQPCRVVAKTPVWLDTDCYRVRFSDGQEIVASGDHLWTIETVEGGLAKTLDTRTIAATVQRGPRGDARYRVRSPEPINLPTADLPVDPYVLGAWLGDGNAEDGRITCADPEIVDCIRAAGFRVESRDRYRHQVFGLKTQLRDLGVLNNKHLPQEYARASTQQRLAVLQGLMDTDGSVYDRGVCEFTTCAPLLRDAVADLLAGLGVKFAIYAGPARLNGRAVGTRWRVKFTVHADLPVFRLSRKAERLRPVRTSRRLYATRRIVSVEPVESVPTVCITVDSPSSLFLAGERMVPTHNSPFTGAVACFEALGPALCDGWDAEGQPVGMPWSEIRRPLVEIAAVSEDQVDTNTWAPLLEMLSRGPVMDEYPGVEPMAGFVNLPYGRIQKRTAEARSAKGAPAHFVVCDQTEEWTPGNGGVRLFNTLRNNVIKRGGHLLESPNAYTPGIGSVAENSMASYRDIKAGRAKIDDGLMFDHREAPPETDMSEPESLLRGLAVAYGDSADIDECVIHHPACIRPGWVNLEHIAASIWEPDADPQLSRSDWLNQITHAANSWMDQPSWAARYHERLDPPVTGISDRDLVTLGFDGSRGRAKGKPDATALVGCRVADGHIFEVEVWEAGPDKQKWPDWTPPIPEIEATIARCFDRYRVAAFYCDPAKDWRSYVNAWEARFAARTVRAPDGKSIHVTRDHPFEWWMSSGRSGLIQRAVEQLEGAIRNGDMSHDGGAGLTRHVLNARRQLSGGKLKLDKENDYSPDKIDAAVAAVLAWQARLDAVAAGMTVQRTTAIRRVR